METVKCLCNMCSTRCGLDVYASDGKIVKVSGMEEHPIHTLCVKPHAIPELVHSKDRLMCPLMKINGKFRETSWEEAFAAIVDKLTTIKTKFGPEAFMIYLGVGFTRSLIEYLARRFCDLYGTPNFTSNASICFLGKTIGHKLTCGAHVSAHHSDLTKCMVVWGQNAGESDPAFADEIYGLLGRGAKLIVIDPRVIPFAKKADIFAQIRPGTDCALALGMLNVIIAEGLYDKPFVEKWTVGFDRLAEHVKEYTPEKVAGITWVDAKTIRQMAHMYADHVPSWISIGIAVEHSTNGIEAIRGITTLMAITGNLDIPGGNIYTHPLRLRNMRLQEKLGKDITVGAKHPLFTRITTEPSWLPLMSQMVTGKPYPIKALLVGGGNPAVTWPNTAKFRRGRDNLDLMIVLDLFMTDTAKMADIVLPGTSFWEREELKSYPARNYNLITLSNRAIPPVGISMDEAMFFVELAKRIGFAEYFPWRNTTDIMKYLLEGTGITLEDLKKNPGGVYYEKRKFQKYLQDGFNTPSGKVEIYSDLMAQHGYDPLPTFHEPVESLVSCPELAEKYPFILIAGTRTIAYYHSQYRNVSSLRKIEPDPLVEIHPLAAKTNGIADGDWVTVESLRGSIIVKAKVTEDIHPQVIAMQEGWSKANVNWLTDDETRDPVSGYPGLKSILSRCRLTKRVG